jgi:hypothetical protein
MFVGVLVCVLWEAVAVIDGVAVEVDVGEGHGVKVSAALGPEAALLLPCFRSNSDTIPH